MPPQSNRIVIIAPIHGKVTRDGKVSEPDVYWIVETWLERHPEIKKRQEDIRVSRGQWTTAEGLKTEVLRVTITAGDDIAGTTPNRMPTSMSFGKRKSGIGSPGQGTGHGCRSNMVLRMVAQKGPSGWEDGSQSRIDEERGDAETYKAAGSEWLRRLRVIPNEAARATER